MNGPSKRKLTDEDFDSWRSSVVTQAVFAHLHAKAADARLRWVAFLTRNYGETPEQVSAWKIELQAKIEILETIPLLELEDIQDDGEGKS